MVIIVAASMVAEAVIVAVLMFPGAAMLAVVVTD